MSLVQLHSKSGTVRTSIFRYQPPDFLQLNLEPYQSVVQIDWHRAHEERHRKTVDWTWTVWIETRL